MLNVTCGRFEVTLTGKDEIMFNGACYQITTKPIVRGFDKTYPVIAKTNAKRLIKDGSLVLDRKETIHDMPVEIYKAAEAVQ